MCPLPTLLLPLALTPALADVSGPATVIDEDTIEIAGKRVRMQGIDAPESAQECQDDMRRTGPAEVAPRPRYAPVSPAA